MHRKRAASEQEYELVDANAPSETVAVHTNPPGLSILLPECAPLPPLPTALLGVPPASHSSPEAGAGAGAVSVLYDLSGVVCHKGKSLTQVGAVGA